MTTQNGTGDTPGSAEPGQEQSSTSAEMRLPLRWIALLYGRIQTDLALTSGIHTASDVIKAVIAGASAAMITSELLKNGASRIQVILEEVEAWMLEHEYQSIQFLKGSLSQKSVAEPAAYERANYIKALKTFRQLP